MNIYNYNIKVYDPFVNKYTQLYMQTPWIKRAYIFVTTTDRVNGQMKEVNGQSPIFLILNGENQKHKMFMDNIKHIENDIQLRHRHTYQYKNVQPSRAWSDTEHRQLRMNEFTLVIKLPETTSSSFKTIDVVYNKTRITLDDALKNGVLNKWCDIRYLHFTCVSLAFHLSCGGVCQIG